ncbi:MAG TPA: hypothetical protein VKX28_06755 [Xanthobacteraceae bacterium]|nr:hypothetical protein [Xanthobacteraceae bacterium]
MTAGTTRGPHFAVLAGLAWLVIVVDLIARHWAGTGVTLGDTDDAMRLAEVHDFLHGQGWFDMHQARLAPPGGYDSHWSRLIDAGLAGLFLFFHQFVDAALAERLMRVVWPLLWLIPAIVAAAAIAWRIAGRDAAVVTLLLAAVGLPAFQQFLPGRIDHHNAQIALAVAVVAATVWSDRVRGAAIAAGALSGVALAIGLENIAFVALCGAAFPLRYAVDRAGADALARYGWSLAASSAAAFFLIVGPDRWGQTECDAIAINWAAPMVLAGLLMGVAATRFASDHAAIRVAAVAASAAAAGLVFALIEPRCLAGPFGMMDPQLRAIWLSHINEMQPLTQISRSSPPVAAALAAFPAFAAGATLLLARELRRDFAFLVAGAIVLIACGLAVMAAKMSMYAMWLGMPLVGAFALRLFARLHLHNLVARAFLALLLTPTVLSAFAIAAVQAAGSPPARERDTRVVAGCFNTASYAQLARLPVGVIAAEPDFGSFILALTPQSVVAAPYHRLAGGIVAAHRMFTTPPDQARRVLQRFGATYVVTCGKRVPPEMTAQERAASLWGRLQAGAPPEWLERVPSAPGDVFAVYRIVAQTP